MRMVDLMKNKFLITIFALCASLYGLVGFWVNLGNETIHPVLFTSIMVANVIAFILIIISAYNWSKEQARNNNIKNGIICLILSLFCFVVFTVLLIISDHIESGKLYSLITALFIALGTTLLFYSLLFMFFSIFKKRK